ncbi:MAG: pro-sigmaK processing inhibitor BofA [Ruminococcaceae bacterium]|nr:pro-sigmaK processing inhibitor BofA [Oscillospiraceae bacterium]
MLKRGVFLVELEIFSKIIGFVLGLLIVFVVCKIFFKPLKFILKLFLNSFIGVLLLYVINLFSKFTNFFIGINPVTAIILGLLGIPGLILIVILKLLI